MDSSLNWMSSWSATLKPTEHQAVAPRNIRRHRRKPSTVADPSPEVEAFLGGPAMAVVEPPTTMVDALEELPTGRRARGDSGGWKECWIGEREKGTLYVGKGRKTKSPKSKESLYFYSQLLPMFHF